LDIPDFRVSKYNKRVLGTSKDALCVYCRQKPVDPRWTPFCSDRCKMADLGRWLTGDYSVPEEPLPEEHNPEHGRDADNH
jgi:hypothetical protein